MPLFTNGSLLFLQYAAEISFLNVIRYLMSATFYWWQFTFAQYAAEISFRKVINKMSRTATFYWWQLLFAQCAAEIRADALFLIHRLMLCVYWHEGSTTREKISYAEAVASAPFFFFLFSREPSVRQF